jgi:hypothetical protein
VNGELRGFGGDGGQALEKVTLAIPPAGRREIDVCGYFAQAQKIEYLSFLSDSGFIAGYTRFSQPGMRASLGATTGTRKGWFLKIEQDGWTGIAFVNVGSATANVTVDAVDEDGNLVTSKELQLNAGKKYVGLVTEMFPLDISRARYFKFESDQQLLGFTVSSDGAGTMLDGLASMPQFSRYLGRQK